ncbi:MFS general substrate transporter [Basidiobolus meristosporus CBS 931.73]|uniref:Autophagy-related protein n=1 Tax=Basidiobolus meristosporus CBS 931.73 TaxID=1314790 RepID=A0A1Y1YTG9_9FUNG|nr:MFS general substrate transporter [Basidiobolus meristosporus CBS 931.73]|eukprot:ORY00865.1 MFS general substrate transporter [Basidiobolus meristosporus CBS 931.73]
MIPEAKVAELEPVDNQPFTTRKELWSYYLFYNGDNGFTMFSYMPNILQYLAYSAGYDSSDPAKLKPCDTNDSSIVCMIPFGSAGDVPVSSMVLYVQAIAFVSQFLLFLTFGSLADYGRWGNWILLLVTAIGCFCQIIPIAFNSPSQWSGMMAVMIFALIAYGASLVFYAAAFPTLADNLPIVRAAKADPEKTKEEKMTITEKWRNHVSTISTTWSNVGFLIVTSILAGISHIPYDGKTLGDATYKFNQVGTVFCGAFWAINAIWYFMFIPKGRRGPPLPKDSNYVTIGWKSVFRALKEVRRLKQAFMYFIAYFLFSDGIATINQMIGIIQAQITSFDGTELTLLNLVSAVTSIIGCISMLYLQKVLKIRTKIALLCILGASALVPIWGCFGISFTSWGIHTRTELWIFYVWSGLAIAPIYAWQQTMLAELIPKGKEGLFFGLFGIVNKASSWIGPVVIGAITNVTYNQWNGWPFILALMIIPMVIIFFIDEKKAKEDIQEYLRIEAAREAALGADIVMEAKN